MANKKGKSHLFVGKSSINFSFHFFTFWVFLFILVATVFFPKIARGNDNSHQVKKNDTTALRRACFCWVLRSMSLDLLDQEGIGRPSDGKAEDATVDGSEIRRTTWDV